MVYLYRLPANRRHMTHLFAQEKYAWYHFILEKKEVPPAEHLVFSCSGGNMVDVEQYFIRCQQFWCEKITRVWSIKSNRIGNSESVEDTANWVESLLSVHKLRRRARALFPCRIHFYCSRNVCWSSGNGLCHVIQPCTYIITLDRLDKRTFFLSLLKVRMVNMHVDQREEMDTNLHYAAVGSDLI